MDVIDLAAVRNARQAPDPEHIRADDFGRPLYQFSCSYKHEDGDWAIDVWAYSREDAQAKVASMRDSLEVQGQVFGTVPA